MFTATSLQFQEERDSKMIFKEDRSRIRWTKEEDEMLNAEMDFRRKNGQLGHDGKRVPWISIVASMNEKAQAAGTHRRVYTAENTQEHWRYMQKKLTHKSIRKSRLPSSNAGPSTLANAETASPSDLPVIESAEGADVSMGSQESPADDGLRGPPVQANQTPQRRPPAWTQEEDQLLRSAVHLHQPNGRFNEWIEIAETMNRTPAAASIYRRPYNARNTRAHWDHIKSRRQPPPPKPETTSAVLSPSAASNDHTAEIGFSMPSKTSFWTVVMSEPPQQSSTLEGMGVAGLLPPPPPAIPTSLLNSRLLSLTDVEAATALLDLESRPTLKPLQMQHQHILHGPQNQHHSSPETMLLHPDPSPASPLRGFEKAIEGKGKEMGAK